MRWLLDHLVVLLLQALELPVDGPGLRLLAQRLEHALHVLHVLARLLKVLLEAAAELRVLYLVDQLGQRFVGKRALDVKDVAEWRRNSSAGS